MSKFIEYLTESVKTYKFKIKIAGDIREDTLEKMSSCLKKYDCDKVPKGKRIPIQESPLDFPEMRNTHVTIFDIECRYPATSQELTQYLSEKLNISASCIRVRNPLENDELESLAADKSRIGTSSEALLGKDYDASNNQSSVGDQGIMSLLKDLSVNKHSGTQVKGINDQLLASSVPAESAPKTDASANNVSPIGSRSSNTDPFKGK